MKTTEKHHLKIGSLTITAWHGNGEMNFEWSSPLPLRGSRKWQSKVIAAYKEWRNQICLGWAKEQGTPVILVEPDLVIGWIYATTAMPDGSIQTREFRA